MSSDDITTTILREIRDEIRTTRSELKSEIGAVRTELGVVRTELKDELAVVGATLKDLSGQLVMLVRYVKNTGERQDGDIDRHEKEIVELRERVARLEASARSR